MDMCPFPYNLPRKRESSMNAPSILMVGILAFSVAVVPAIAGGQSSAQKKLDSERQKFITKQAEKKQAEENAKAKLEMFTKNPELYYQTYIAKKFVALTNKIEPADYRQWKVIQVVDKNTAIFTGGGLNDAVAVEMESTEGLVDNLYTNACLVKVGTYRYTSLIGVVKTVRRCVIKDALSFEDYMALRKEGVQFPDDPK